MIILEQGITMASKTIVTDCSALSYKVSKVKKRNISEY